MRRGGMTRRWPRRHNLHHVTAVKYHLSNPNQSPPNKGATIIMSNVIVNEIRTLIRNLWRVVVPAVVVAIVTGLTAQQVDLSNAVADGHWMHALDDLATIGAGAVTAAIQAAKHWVHRETA